MIISYDASCEAKPITSPAVYSFWGQKGFLRAIRLPANQMLQREIEHLTYAPSRQSGEEPGRLVRELLVS